MTNEELKSKIIESICKEFQAIWLVDANDLSMQVFSAMEDKIIPNSVSSAIEMNSYVKAYEWYISKFIVKSDREKVTRAVEMDRVMRETESGNPYYVEYERINGDCVNYNQLVYDRVYDGDVVKYILLGFRDIDVRKKAEIDDITGLYTRQIFIQKAEELVRNNPDKQIDIIISDIVDFKKINETYGAKTADSILAWMGRNISTYSCDDLIVGRYSGDQMVILGVHEEVAKHLTNDERDKIREQERTNGLPDVVTKFGVYNNINHNQSVISCCDKARIALNSIKRHYDIDIAYYDDVLQKAVDKQRRIEDSMYQSLKKGDFKVFYQPKHDAITGELVGAEALIRWIHPEYGFMSPADFIPLFEQNGFIVENDRFVWRRTCENIRRWNDKGLVTVPVSVNFSKLTMKNLNLIDDMQIPVNNNGISAKDLHIEITETLMTDDVEELVRKLSYIRTLGYEIELDDFGSGFSSLNVLSVLPLDVVKLDMSFMQQFGDSKRAKVLAACIDLAKSLGYRTVSEGVEHNEQKDVLGELGVDMIQGYYYSKPLSEDDFEQYLKDNMN